MKILLAIDDTDRARIGDEKVRGTGELAGMIAEDMETKGWGTTEPISRHQLYVHPDIPYTSHNSSMCFAADIQPARLDDIIDNAINWLLKEQAAGSDPGLCVLVCDRITRPSWLVNFGYQAKNTVLNKDLAYGLAEELGIHLSEHGGTGQGVIGALAATGLRWCGNDGRVRGKLKLSGPDGAAAVHEIITASYVKEIRSIETGEPLSPTARIWLGEHLKAVWREGKPILYVKPNPAAETDGIPWQTCSKEQLKMY